MPVRFYRCFLFALILFFGGLPLNAQSPTAATPKPQWFKVAVQSDWIAGLPAGSIIAWGDGTLLSNAVTTSASLNPSTGFEATSAQFTLPAGMASANGLYVEEGAAAVTFTVVPFATQVAGPVTVPAIGPAPPAQPPASIVSSIWGLLQSSTPGVANQVQITCAPSAAAMTLPAGVTLPVYGTPPIACVFAVIQVGVPVVPPVATPPAPAAASK